MPGTKQLFRVLAGALLVVAMLVQDSDSPLTRGAGGLWAQDDETAEEVFRDHISGPVVQSKCVNCHVQGGVSGHTRLVFVRRSAASEKDYEALNLRAFENLLDDLADEGGGSYVLNKIQGVAHGGGVQVPLGSADFANMQRFLGLLGEGVTSAALTPETLFDTVVLASPRKTLRRAALIFAGRIPTDAEYAAVEGGDEWDLRATIRGLMEGPQFHEFLLRASNDRLLTDRQGTVIHRNDGYLVDFTDEAYRRREAAYASGGEEYHIWEDRVQFGFRRAPLELIAYVVENDLPYTEILTADYIMANPWAAAAYGASTQFDNPNDVHEFKPSRIVSYYRHGEGFESEHNRVIDGLRIIDPGPLLTDYPHAGILNTTVFLLRYPTTATNRNRARARWTYYHFLGLDVEKSASRTTDPMALADTNNPTMHNPNCTVCHSVLDPVAGAFQNYGDDGMYKDQWGGMDSLDEFYKHAPPGRRDIPVSQRSREEGTTFLGTVRLFADIDNELGLKNLRAFEGDRKLHLEIGEVVVRTLNGDVVDRYQIRDAAAEEACGSPIKEGYVLWDCGEMLVLPLDVPTDGDYSVEIEVWVREQGEKAATLQVWMPGPFYRKGDTWYHDMRMPGFAGATAPNPDNSVQWLAQQIVADERFAEAAVQFWWPAVMGSEVAEYPEDAADADFEAQLLAASAQDMELVRLANGFRDGFPGSPYTYNLKDLLVEVVLSKWFRADAVTDADPVRRVALRNAGARRLLTPEELARKTAAVTGVQWGRRLRTHCWPECERLPNALTGDYGLLYGGIDSDGITERARDVTAVMAGVAKRHAAEVSCPVVMREFYLLPDAKRRLFAGVAPALELSARFEIESSSRAARETLSLSGALTAGSKIVKFSISNPYWDEVNRRGRVIRLDRVDVRNTAGQVVASREIEDVEWSGGSCDGPGGDHFFLRCSSVDVPINGLAAANYTIEIVAWAGHAGDEFPRLVVTVLTTEGIDSGADAIRHKLVELHDKLLGVQVTPDSPEVEATYQLFVDVRKRKRESNNDWFEYWRCGFAHDHFYLDGILDNVVIEKVNDHGRYRGFDWDRVHEFLESTDFSDPGYTAQAWVDVLAAMMMDYRYLYLN